MHHVGCKLLFGQVGRHIQGHPKRGLLKSDFEGSGLKKTKMNTIVKSLSSKNSLHPISNCWTFPFGYYTLTAKSKSQKPYLKPSSQSQSFSWTSIFVIGGTILSYLGLKFWSHFKLISLLYFPHPINFQIFLISFLNHLLNANYVPDTVSGLEDTWDTKKIRSSFVLRSL